MGDFRATLYQHLLRAQERDGVDRLEPTNLIKLDPTVSQSITGPKAKREKKQKKKKIGEL